MAVAENAGTIDPVRDTRDALRAHLGRLYAERRTLHEQCGLKDDKIAETEAQLAATILPYRVGDHVAITEGPLYRGHYRVQSIGFRRGEPTLVGIPLKKDGTPAKRDTVNLWVVMEHVRLVKRAAPAEEER